jgi:endonuclease YncB( thermonuclease family)
MKILPSASLPVIIISAVKRIQFRNYCCWQKLALCLALAWTASAEAGRASQDLTPLKWVTLRDCRLIADQYRDGDSFHVACSGKEYVFRLYFVDAPETSDEPEERLREQQKHFGVTHPLLKEAGAAARQFTAEQLKHGFSVTTRWENAGGRGRLPRFYAFVNARGRDLGELLVARGLARTHGEDAILPNGVRAKDHRAKLRSMEKAAREKRIGIWQNSQRSYEGSRRRALGGTPLIPSSGSPVPPFRTPHSALRT